MIYIVLGFFIFGFILGILFNKYVNVEIKLKNKPILKKNTNLSNNTVIDDINLLLNEVKNNKELPINLSPVVFRSLIEISNTNNWENKLDNETIKNLHKIYDKWQRHINSNNNTKINKLGLGSGFCEYWEGTIEEYNEAMKNGEIDENTKVKIYQYSDETYSINDNGVWEENI